MALSLEDKVTIIQNALNFLRDSLRDDPECFAYWSALANYNQDVVDAILRYSPTEKNYTFYNKYSCFQIAPTTEELDGDCLDDEDIHSIGVIQPCRTYQYTPTPPKRAK